MHQRIVSFVKSNPPFFIGLSIALLCYGYFSSRYMIGLASYYQLPCIDAKLMIIDKWQKDIPEGALASFRMNKQNDFFEPGLAWTKVVGGREGTTVKVERDRVVINDNQIRTVSISHLLPHVSLKEEDLLVTHTVPKDAYFMIGETPTSYDSRYWGFIDQSEIIGRAYVVF